MLLNYEIDTKDEQLNPTAIELRRRIASRKLQEKIVRNDVDADVLLAIKESNRNEIKEQMHEQMTVTNAGLGQRVAMGRLDQQMNLSKNLGK